MSIVVTSAQPGLPRRISRYELVRRLAIGGMAEIFLARTHDDTGRGREVVIKQILPHYAAQLSFVKMFLDEARVAAQLRHPNIVHVFDVGQDDDQYFMAMELLEGADLHAIANRLRQRHETLSLADAVAVTRGICAGLHHAHEQRDSDGKALEIVHRDVSPQNVFVTFDGMVKVLDFGIAKASDRLTETTTGAIKGKVSYMAPEQCRADLIDRRTDIFATTALLWELTVGERLFQGKTDFQIMKAITDGKVTPPSERVADYPPALEAIVLKGLALDPAARWATAHEMGEALAALATAHGWTEPVDGLGALMGRLFAAERTTASTATARPTPTPTPSPSPSPMSAANTVVRPMPTAALTDTRRHVMAALIGAAIGLAGLGIFGITRLVGRTAEPIEVVAPEETEVAPVAPVGKGKPLIAPVAPVAPPEHAAPVERVATKPPRPPSRHASKRASETPAATKKPLRHNLDALMD